MLYWYINTYTEATFADYHTHIFKIKTTTLKGVDKKLNKNIKI